MLRKILEELEVLTQTSPEEVVRLDFPGGRKMVLMPAEMYLAMRADQIAFEGQASKGVEDNVSMSSDLVDRGFSKSL